MEQQDAPGLVAFLAPGGLFGARRKCVVEIKAGPGLVVPLDPGSIVIASGSETHDLAHNSHLTVHSSLMVHVRDDDSRARIEVRPALRSGETCAGPFPLCIVGTGDPLVVEEYQPARPQKTYQGGAILSIRTNPAPLPSQQAAVQIWAIPVGHAVPDSPPTTNAVPAPTDGKGCTFGPMPAELAFKWRRPPQCWFGFSTWWVSAPAAAGRPFVAAHGASLG